MTWWQILLIAVFVGLTVYFLAFKRRKNEVVCQICGMRRHDTKNGRHYSYPNGPRTGEALTCRTRGRHEWTKS